MPGAGNDAAGRMTISAEEAVVGTGRLTEGEEQKAEYIRLDVPRVLEEKADSEEVDNTDDKRIPLKVGGPDRYVQWAGSRSAHR